jgi:hypothetical protein
LNGVKSETGLDHQFAHVTLLQGREEERAQEFRSDKWKQDFQDFAF